MLRSLIFVSLSVEGPICQRRRGELIRLRIPQHEKPLHNLTHPMICREL
jgi:hypothetical protein